MARGINKVILIGNCGQDPETKHAASGAAITNLSVATSDSWKDKQTGQTQERTEWHRVVFFNRLAEVAGEYLRKGSKVYIEGRLQTRKWQDQNGQDRYSTEIVAGEMQMLDSKGPDHDNQRSGPQSAQQPQGRPQQPQGQNAYPPQGHAPPQQGYPQQGAPQYDQGIPDDDIPFYG